MESRSPAYTSDHLDKLSELFPLDASRGMLHCQRIVTRGTAYVTLDPPPSHTLIDRPGRLVIPTTFPGFRIPILHGFTDPFTGRGRQSKPGLDFITETQTPAPNFILFVE